MLARVPLTIAALLATSATAAAPKQLHAKPMVESVRSVFNAPSLASEAPQPIGPEATAAAEPFAVADATSLNVTVTHAFTRDAARERVSELLQYWDRRFGVKSEWHGFRVFLTGKVLGIAIRALFEVEDGDVVAMAEDPGTLLSGAARRYVEAKLRKYLSANYQEP